MAVGAAWSATLRGTDQVAVAFFGDGATNIGAFHEALNLAAVWRLPVVFVCENNLYMEYTPIAAVTAVPRPAADRAASYGLPPVTVDGNDVLAVRETARAAVDRARDGAGPALIEALTYRHFGTAAPTPRRTGRRRRWSRGWRATRSRSPANAWLAWGSRRRRRRTSTPAWSSSSPTPSPRPGRRRRPTRPRRSPTSGPTGARHGGTDQI
jgi:hypothetical protein